MKAAAAAAAVAAAADPELGATTGTSTTRDRTDSLALPAAVTAGRTTASASGDHSDSESRASTAKSKLSKWTSALTGVGDKEQTDAKEATATSADEAAGAAKSAGRRTELVCRKSEHIQVVKDIRPPTQGNKWPKLPVTARPETIDEGENEATAVARALISSGQSGGGARSSVTSLIGKGSAVSSQDIQQLLSTLLEIKVDLKCEIHKLNQRMSKIDQHVDGINQRMMKRMPLDQPVEHDTPHEAIADAPASSAREAEAAVIAAATASTIDLLKSKSTRGTSKSKFSVASTPLVSSHSTPASGPAPVTRAASTSSSGKASASSKGVSTVSSMPPVSVTSAALAVEKRSRQAQEGPAATAAAAAPLSELDAGEMRARMDRELEGDTSVASVGTATGTDDDQDLTSKL